MFGIFSNVMFRDILYDRSMERLGWAIKLLTMLSSMRLVRCLRWMEQDGR